MRLFCYGLGVLVYMVTIECWLSILAYSWSTWSSVVNDIKELGTSQCTLNWQRVCIIVDISKFQVWRLTRSKGCIQRKQQIITRTQVVHSRSSRRCKKAHKGPETRKVIRTFKFLCFHAMSPKRNVEDGHLRQYRMALLEEQ